MDHPCRSHEAEADHRVPLSDRALNILEKLDRKTKFVFSGENPNKKLPHEDMLKVLKGDLGRPFTVHGFRSSFKDWASERQATPTRFLRSRSRIKSRARP